jgi:hypothetical protein
MTNSQWSPEMAVLSAYFDNPKLVQGLMNTANETLALGGEVSAHTPEQPMTPIEELYARMESLEADVAKYRFSNDTRVVGMECEHDKLLVTRENDMRRIQKSLTAIFHRIISLNTEPYAHNDYHLLELDKMRRRLQYAQASIALLGVSQLITWVTIFFAH